MNGVGDFYTTEAAASRLGVTVRRVQQMVDDGELVRVARGLVDAASLDRYAAAGQGGRTRVWTEPTAWAAIAILSGVQPTWLGQTQASRLRGTLRTIAGPADLVVRTRDRAVVRTYAGHPSARQRLRSDLVSTDVTVLGLVDAHPTSADLSGSGTHRAGAAIDRVDGYLAVAALNSTLERLGLVADPLGSITLRATGFDITTVRELAESGTTVLAALDAATSLDPRERGIGMRVITDALARHRR